MPRRDHIDPAALGDQQRDKAAFTATGEGRIKSNWTTIIAVVGVAFGAGVYFNAKATAFSKVEESVNRLDDRMAKIEQRVGNLEIVTQSMDHKIFTMDTKIDAIMRRYGVPPLVDAK